MLLPQHTQLGRPESASTGVTGKQLSGLVPDQINGTVPNGKPFNLRHVIEQERTPLVIKTTARTGESLAGIRNQVTNNEN